MTDSYRVFSTCDMGDALNLLRSRRATNSKSIPVREAPPKVLILEKAPLRHRRSDDYAPRLDRR